MAEQAFTEKADSGQMEFEGVKRSARGAADQASSAAKELKDKASDFASSTGDTIRQQASDYADAAKDTAKEMGADAADRFKEMVETQKDAGARYVGGIAEAMRRAAREFDHDLPIAGTSLRKAASQVDAASNSVRSGDFDDLLRAAQDFARKQPTAFLGITVLAGFGIVRFLKSSNQHASDGTATSRPPLQSEDVVGY